MWFLGICFVITLVVVRVSHWLYGWSNPRCNGKLPPGSMGLPIIGETIEFFSSVPNLYDVPPFFKKRMQRYGPVFRTSLVGQKVIVSTDHEINYEIFQQENKNFLIWYTESFIKILGEQSMATNQGMVHKYLKNLIRQLISPENLRLELIHEMDEEAQKHLRLCATQGTSDVKEVASDMIFKYFSKKLISYEDDNGKLRENFQAFFDGLVSFPLNIPGTAYHACIQSRKNAIKVIEEAIEKRKTSKETHNDFLDHLLKEMQRNDTFLTEKFAIDLVFLVLFASYETTSAAITWAVKFISDHPQVLAELTKEHEAILKKRENPYSRVTWQEYKSMTFTHMVINETVRLGNIVPVIFRKVMKDVEMKGYTIPAGWVVMVVPPAVHLDSHRYDDPLAFNPWRWEGQELHAGSKSFMAFGGGIRLCVGADFAKLQTAIFLHYLVTKYQWRVVKGGEIIRKPALVFPNGLHIEISEKQKC